MRIDLSEENWLIDLRVRSTFSRVSNDCIDILTETAKWRKTFIEGYEYN